MDDDEETLTAIIATSSPMTPGVTSSYGGDEARYSMPGAALRHERSDSTLSSTSTPPVRQRKSSSRSVSDGSDSNNNNATTATTATASGVAGGAADTGTITGRGASLTPGSAVGAGAGAGAGVGSEATETPTSPKRKLSVREQHRRRLQRHRGRISITFNKLQTPEHHKRLAKFTKHAIIGGGVPLPLILTNSEAVQLWLTHIHALPFSLPFV